MRADQCKAWEWTSSFQQSEQYSECQREARRDRAYCWVHAYYETVDELANHYGIDTDTYDEPGSTQMELFDGEEFRRDV